MVLLFFVFIVVPKPVVFFAINTAGSRLLLLLVLSLFVRLFGSVRFD